MALRVEAVVQLFDRAAAATTAQQVREHDAEGIDQAAEAGQGDDQVDPVAFLAAAHHVQTAEHLTGDE
ncbi:hypothetical protein D3C78_1875850 [compost metagenome]